MKIISPIDWQEVTSREIYGGLCEIRRDGRALRRSVIETRPYHHNMNSERIVQHRTHIHTLNSFAREEIIKH
jgi:hypothetical protein